MMEFSCPVCSAKTNRAGRPFVSEWAVACHISGNIGSGDSRHRAWAEGRVSDVDLNQSILGLAEALVPLLNQAKDANHSPIRTPTPLSLAHEAELRLHEHIRRRLEGQFGLLGERWWAEGVPLPIRQDCARRREEDGARRNPYTYTYLIDLKAILERNWTLFEEDHARVRASLHTKKDFLALITRLNDVRNRHAHPTRAPRTQSKEFVEDLTFVSRATQLLSDFCGSP